MFELEMYSVWIGEYLDLAIAKRGVKNKEILKLKSMPAIELAYKATLAMQPAILNYMTLASCSSAIGRVVLQGLEDPELSERNREVSRFKTGYYLLNVLFDKGVLKLDRDSKDERDPWKIKEVDKEWIENLFYIADINPLDIPINIRPSFTPIEPFVEFEHKVAGDLVRNVNKDAVELFKEDLMPLVYETINKHSSNSYRINQDVLSVYNQSQGDDLFTLNHKSLTEEQREGMEREMFQTLTIATGVGGRKFWEYMFYDNRGRLYSSAAYLSHQGSKLSKSLFLYDEKKALGDSGYFWMLVHAANSWGFDKASIDDRHDYAEDEWNKNWESWANDPLKNKGWQQADDPFNFLAVILEIKKANEGVIAEYQSGLPIAWDATCSGLQVLSALSRDKVSGALCNLTNTPIRGDYYKMIAEKIWLDASFTKAEEKEYEATLEKMKHDIGILGLAIKDAKGNAAKKEAIEARKQYTIDNTHVSDMLSRVFWGRAKVSSKKRAVVKRPCMTYFYSCGARTMSKQLFSDYRSDKDFAGLQPFMCYWLCSRIYNTCRSEMPIATQMMDLAIELGLADYSAKKDFNITAPNGFVMMQNYKANVTEKIEVPYKKKRIQVRIIIGKAAHLDYRKIKSATSPNLVHMLDAQIVSSVLLNTEYMVSCIHDSFSCSAADAGKLYEDTRTCFIDLFPETLIFDLLKQKKFELNEEKGWDGKLGALDLDETSDNEYCFS